MSMPRITSCAYCGSPPTLGVMAYQPSEFTSEGRAYIELQKHCNDLQAEVDRLQALISAPHSSGLETVTAQDEWPCPNCGADLGHSADCGEDL